MSEFAPERPRTPEGLKEGVMVETSFENSRPTILPPFLQLSPHTGMTFEPDGRSITHRGRFSDEEVPLYRGTLVTWKSEEDLKKQRFIPIEKQTKKGTKPALPYSVLFAGSMDGWYAHDARVAMPLNNFFVVGVQPYRGFREPDGSMLLSLSHELGHTGIMDRGEDLQLAQETVRQNVDGLPKRQQIFEYAALLAKSIGTSRKEQLKNFALGAVEFSNRAEMWGTMGRYRRIDRDIRIFHERHAWSDGFRFLRNIPFLDEELRFIDKREIPQPPKKYTSRSSITFAQRCLATYADPRGYNDKHFTKGFHK